MWPALTPTYPPPQHTPSVTSHVTGKSRHQCSSLWVMLEFPFSMLQLNTWFPPPAHPAFIFHISVQISFPTLGADLVQRNSASRSLKWADPAFWALFHFIFISFFIVFVRRISFPAAYAHFPVTVSVSVVFPAKRAVSCALLEAGGQHTHMLKTATFLPPTHTPTILFWGNNQCLKSCF